MVVVSLGKQNHTYATWYEFKRDLEKRLGHLLTNWAWLEVKPQSSLPWSYRHMKRSYEKVVRLQERAYMGGSRTKLRGKV